MGITSMIAKAALGSADSGKDNKALLVIMGKSTEKIPVQFNPSQYSITHNVVYTQRERRNEDDPSVSYDGSRLSTLSVQLIFNSAEFTSVQSVVNSAKALLMGGPDNDITKTINKIVGMTKIDGDKHRPPDCAFVWGSMLFSGIVESVGVTYTMFDANGKPLSAVVNLTMKGSDLSSSLRTSPRQSPDRTKSRVLTEDANIWGIAKKEYGDVREWRRIAESNDITNPLDIPVGKVLRVPSIND